MSDETDTTSEVARVLGEHRIECTGLEGVTCRGCRERGWMSRLAFEKHHAEALAEAGLLAEEDMGTELLIREREDTLRDLHARYHDEVGNLLGRDECGWEGCEYWDAAKVTMEELDRAGLLQPQIATQEPAGEPGVDSAERGASGGLGERLRDLVAEPDPEESQYESVDVAALVGLADEAQRLEVHARVVEQSLRTSREEGDGARIKGAQWKARYEVARDASRRVLEVAQWFQGQGLVGYARKVEEAVEGVDDEHTPEPQHDHKWVFVTTYDARGLAVQQCTIEGCGVKRDMATGGVVLGLPTTNPFRPEDPR